MEEEKTWHEEDDELRVKRDLLDAEEDLHDEQVEEDDEDNVVI